MAHRSVFNDQAGSGRFPEPSAWHAQTPETCLALQSSAIDGLSDEQAVDRLKHFGPNRLPEVRRAGLIILFLRQFASPLIYLLLGSSLISLYLDRMLDAAFITGVLILNAAIGAFQEMRADASARALRALLPDVARIRRGGVVRELSSVDVVPGDVAELESGMRVMADMRLIVSQNLTADESTLTGESLPVAKCESADIAAAAPVADRSNMVHAGSIISGGRGIGLVTATGTATELGRIGRSLELAGKRDAVPPLVSRMALLSRQIAMAAIAMILLLSLLLAAEGRQPEEIFLLAVALAVSAIPEGLPVAVTVALAAATRRMAERQVVVRTLPAVEGLGACTLIASDKTGTLTINRLTVERTIDAAGAELQRSAWIAGAPTDGQIALAMAAAVCNEAQLTGDSERMTGDAVDVALLAFARETGIDIKHTMALYRSATIPYEPALRFAAVEAMGADGPRIYVKGALETVLPMCASINPCVPEKAGTLAAVGYRVLAIAEGPGGEGEIASRLNGLRLLGVVGLADPLRPEVAEAISRCREAGVGVRMITGDHPVTARSIAAQLGLACAPGEVVTGQELARLRETGAIAQRVIEGRVFARIDPAQKLQIVQILQEAGETVAVTGDGVNDAPALKIAAIGVAMGRNGTDVAREASDLIIADDNFASIVSGIEEARITFSNVRKIVMFVLATGMAEIGMFLGATALGLPMPLTAVQLLWLNIVTNGAQDVMLGFGRGEGDELKHPPRGRAASLIDREALTLMLPAVMVMTAFALWLLHNQLAAGASIEEARNGVLLMTVLFQNVYVLAIRHLRHAAWRRRRPENHWLFLGVGAAVMLHVGMMILPLGQRLLGIALVNAVTLLQCLIGAALVLIATEGSKAWIRSRRPVSFASAAPGQS